MRLESRLNIPLDHSGIRYYYRYRSHDRGETMDELIRELEIEVMRTEQMSAESPESDIFVGALAMANRTLDLAREAKRRMADREPAWGRNAPVTTEPQEVTLDEEVEDHSIRLTHLEEVRDGHTACIRNAEEAIAEHHLAASERPAMTPSSKDRSGYKRGYRDPYRLTLIAPMGTTTEQVANLVANLLQSGLVTAWQIEGPGSRGLVAGGYPAEL
jgi:hypothetical protein